MSTYKPTSPERNTEANEAVLAREGIIPRATDKLRGFKSIFMSAVAAQERTEAVATADTQTAPEPEVDTTFMERRQAQLAAEQSSTPPAESQEALSQDTPTTLPFSNVTNIQQARSQVAASFESLGGGRGA